MARDNSRPPPDHEPLTDGPPRAISSLQNESVKLIRSLDMRKARRETGLFVAEGASVLITARDNGWSPRILVTGPGSEDNPATRGLQAWATKAAADRLDVTAAVLEKLASKDNPQSVIGVFEQQWADVPSSSRPAATGELWLALEEIRDPGNLGTILRTAHAAGVTGVILAGNTCDPYSSEAVRASMGSIFAVPVARCDTQGLLKLLAAWPGDVIGTHLTGPVDYRAADYRDPVLLVMGNEGAGLSEAVTSACGKLVRIPMAGDLDSLNLAIATALMVFEIRRPTLKLPAPQR